jgi:AraC family transcriptional regulator of adaptative response/methylated-DNA-[protein]-cysteine methyltransferase
VQFHVTRKEAERAGFRACKRCKPDQAVSVDSAAGDIQFAISPCSLGTVLMAQTERGVCAILLGDNAEVLTRDLKRRFSQARVSPGGKAVERAAAQVAAFVDAPTRGLKLPLDPQGTAFQRRTWQALRRIPAGRTASYAEIARKIGAPTAMRAVAQACAANPLAVAIPCHRVVRRDGGLSGYRWGVERKRALLSREARA